MFFRCVFRCKALSSWILKKRESDSGFNCPRIRSWENCDATIDRCQSEVQSWKRHVVACSISAYVPEPPPLGLTGTCHFCRQTPEKRDEKPGSSARLSQYRTAARFPRAWYEHAWFGNHVSRYPSPSVEWRASRYANPEAVSVVQPERNRMLRSLGVSFLINQ